jgi:chromosome segregation ATPase
MSDKSPNYSSDTLEERIRDLEVLTREQENMNGKLCSELSTILVLLKDIKTEVADVSQTTKRVEIQANKTNGRVTRSEQDIEKINDHIEKIVINWTQKEDEQNRTIQNLKEEKVKHRATIKALFLVASGVSVIIGLSMQLVGLIIYYWLSTH